MLEGRTGIYNGFSTINPQNKSLAEIREEAYKQGREDAIAEFQSKLLIYFCEFCSQEPCSGGTVGTIQECTTIKMLRDVLGDLADEMKGENG